MEIEIKIENKGIFVIATVFIDGKEQITLPFASVEQARNWAKNSMEELKKKVGSEPHQCDNCKCKADREPSPEPTPEPAPAWTPEVGMLVEWNKSAVVCEITKLRGGGCIEISELSGGTILTHADNCRPIAELEGLKVGDKVYCKAQNTVHEWRITAITHTNPDNPRYKIELMASHSLEITQEGKPVFVEARFWRTFDRAERFGK